MDPQAFSTSTYSLESRPQIQQTKGSDTVLLIQNKEQERGTTGEGKLPAAMLCHVVTTTWYNL
jgi:hypothetical protein